MSVHETKPVTIIEISDEDQLYRRIFPLHIKENGQVSSAAFKSKDPKLSVDVAKLTTPKKSLLSYPQHGLASIIAGFCRKLSQKVYHDPLPENLAHGIVEGKKTDSIAKKIALCAILIIPPPSTL